jgi:hypothetical protein
MSTRRFLLLTLILVAGKTTNAQVDDPTALVDCFKTKYACELRNGNEDGTFVCSTRTHPVTGELRSRARCFPSQPALVVVAASSNNTATCGCCLSSNEEGGEELDCPIRPEFDTLECDTSTQPDLPGVITSFWNDILMENGVDTTSIVERIVICRTLVNPFTGDDQPTTMIIPKTGAVDGDSCGCCPDVGCPGNEPLFARPDLVEKSCVLEVDSYQECDLPPALEEGEEGAPGFFVCRTFHDPRGLVEARQKAVCISERRAWESDECGCCEGQACPERSVALDSECSSSSTTSSVSSCDLKSGQEGVFVCRTIFHPVDGLPREREFCIPSNRGWITDTCGCCEDEDEGGGGAVCPTTPAGGFSDESVQMAALALEIPDDFYETTYQDDDDDDDDDDDSSSGGMVVVQSPCWLFLSTMLLILSL